ncbi:MAG: FecR domain-containing protein [Bacteroidales bacterium]
MDSDSVNEISWFRTIFDLHYHSIRNYAYFKTASLKLADEIAQDSFMRLWAMRPQIKRGYKKSLPYIIASRMLYRRRHQISKEGVPQLNLTILEGEETYQSNALSPKQFEYLTEALRFMPKGVRVVFLMSIIEGLSQLDIAERLTINVNIVEKRLSDAHRIIHEHGLFEHTNENSLQEYHQQSEHRMGTLQGPLNISVPTSVDREVMWEHIIQSINRENLFVTLRRKVLPWGGLAILVIMVVSMLIDWQFATSSHNVPNGKFGYAMLPDSTTVILNAGSTIKHKKYGWEQRREVELQGEAYFSVNRSKGDVYINLGDNSVKARFGRFNVYSRKRMIILECYAGSLEMMVEGMLPKKIRAGQEVRYSQNQTDLKELWIDPSRGATWTRGLFEFRNLPFSHVFEEIERQFDATIHTQGFNPESRLFTGSFTNENLNVALEDVCEPNNLHFESKVRTDVIIIQPAN